MNDIERLNQLEKRIEELQLETMRLRSRLDQYDEGEAEARMLRRIQHKLFVQQLYSIVTKEQVRQWVEEAVERQVQKYAEKYMDTDRIQRWLRDTAQRILDNAGNRWLTRTIVEEIAGRYILAPKPQDKPE